MNESVTETLFDLAAYARGLLPQYAAAAAAEEPAALRVAHAGGRVLRIATLLLRCPFVHGGDLQILQREVVRLAGGLEAADDPLAAHALIAIAAKLGGHLRARRRAEEGAEGEALAALRLGGARKAS